MSDHCMMREIEELVDGKVDAALTLCVESSMSKYARRLEALSGFVEAISGCAIKQGHET